MTTIFRAALRRLRGQIIGWGLALCLLSVLTAARYEIVRENQEQMRQLLKGSAGKVAAMFGDTSKLTTPEGFLSLSLFSYLPLVLGVFAVLAGSGLLAADEEAGTLDLILAHPVRRTSLFAGRLLAFVAALVAVLALSWLGFIVAMTWSSLSIGWGAMARPYLSLLAVLLFFGGLALLLSLLLPSRRMAASAAGLALMVSFFLTTLARLDKDLEGVARLSPITYYQGGEAISELNGQWLIGLLAVSALFFALAAWLFQRRDIRVAGEGVWRWPILLRRRTLANAGALTGGRVSSTG
jgi:ABC-2 type transport system permease protein